MRGKYYIKIHFLYFHLNIIFLQVLCANIIINTCIIIDTYIIINTYYRFCCGENEFNSINLIFWVILINYNLFKSVSKTVLGFYKQLYRIRTTTTGHSI